MKRLPTFFVSVSIGFTQTCVSGPFLEPEDINLYKPNNIYIYIYIYIYMSYRSAKLQTLHYNIYSTNIPNEYFKHAA